MTADGIELDGAAYHPEPSMSPVATGFLVLHGLKWNFYRGPSRWLAPLLAQAGFATLALNFRDHDSQEPAAAGLELAHHDIRAGLDALSSRCAETILLAHGYGCTKAIAYVQAGDERVQRRVLATLGAVKRYQPDIWTRTLDDARSLQGHTLVVQGGADPAVEGRARADELAAAAARCRTDIVVLEGANHYFADHRQPLVDAIGAWAAPSPSAS